MSALAVNRSLQVCQGLGVDLVGNAEQRGRLWRQCRMTGIQQFLKSWKRIALC
jgi:hypothetical protein